MSVVLVLTTVHPPDDPRVRLRTVGVLARRFGVRYATQQPGPTDTADHEWVPLDGGRLRRTLAATRQALRRDVALLSIHDPELVPLGLVVAILRRIPVVFDVHEDLPAQIRTKEWLPRWARPMLAPLAGLLLRVAERRLTITLASTSCAHLFASRHSVLPNYPLVPHWPHMVDQGDEIVYVGDVTEIRGALFAVEVVAALSTPRRLRMIGRTGAELRRRILVLASRAGVDVDLPGFLPHDAAMEAVAGAAAGLCPLADVPSYRHALPTKTLEYLALGVPVLASDLPGTRSVVRGRSGVRLLAPRDRAAWTAALEAVVNDHGLREETQEAAAAVRSEFQWPAERLLAIYASLLGDGPGRRVSLAAKAPSSRPRRDEGKPSA